ncbi:sensor histidine kinase [Microbacterium sp. ZW T5_45]|uniref:sensor histidine kinase n=1 Tax=Microbacterium sp. ZW T5_45 TaxID=3378080 RepID=UPI003851B856
MSPHTANRARDAADDRRRLLNTAGVVLAVFSVGAAIQTAFVHQVPVAGALHGAAPIGFLLRVTINLIACAAALGIAAWLKLAALAGRRLTFTALGIAVIVALVRFSMQVATGIYVAPSLTVALVEFFSGAVVVLVALGFGMMQVRAQVRLRLQERSLAEQRLRASEAVAALAEEELEVRRTVAEGLHGGLQSRLVMLRVQLDHVIGTWDEVHPGSAEVDVLRRVRRELDALREDEVRKLSHLLYPDGVDISLSHALTQLVRRIPPQIAVEALIDPVSEQEARVDPEHGAKLVAWRVAALRAAEEGINNALRHGGAARLRVTLRGVPDGVELIVDDDGEGMPEPPPRMRGLARSADRLSRFGGTQRIAVSDLGGVALAVTLPTAGGAVSGGQVASATPDHGSTPRATS